MSEENRQHHEDSGRHKFRLPVLKGFEPKLLIKQIAAERHNLTTVANGFILRCHKARPPVKYE